MKIILILIVFCFQNLLAQNFEWQIFKKLYRRYYASKSEEIQRWKIFQDNVNFIREHNKKYKQGLTTYDMEINGFADWNLEEYNQLYGLRFSIENNTHLGMKLQIFKNTPKEIDWRMYGAVGPVLQQGSCGSCWSFSALGSLEAQIKIKSGHLLSLSEQMLVDCSGSYGNMGCKGGYMTAAFEFIKDYGVTTSQNYPYEGIQRQCRMNHHGVIKIRGYENIQSGNEDQLKLVVGNVGPVAIAMETTRSFVFYKSGIFKDDTCQGTMNHAMLAVGYGSQNGDHWIIKNSWGIDWGENGYIRVARNFNMCGIASVASYPIL